MLVTDVDNQAALDRGVDLRAREKGEYEKKVSNREKKMF